MSRAFAWQLSRNQRDMLIAHVDLPQPIVRGGTAERTRLTLINLKLLFFCSETGQQGWEGISVAPKWTTLTNDGRDALAFILAEYAEALIRCGYLTDEIGPIPGRINRPLNISINSVVKPKGRPHEDPASKIPVQT